MSKNPKKNRSISIPELLRDHWRESYFSQTRDLSEISAALAANGHHFSLSSISVALMRAVKPGGFLSRIKESSRWKYIQKHPVTSESGQSKEPFACYDFHTRVKEVAFKQFENKDFKGAIQNALVEVINEVKVKTRHPKGSNGKDLDGDDLMNHVFGCDNQRPKIKFNPLKTSLDKAEQRGLMNLFKGIVGVRDKKAHLNFIQHDPLKTIEYLSLASLLMRLLDENSPIQKHK